MENSPQPVNAANLRFLRLLVTGLTGTMIAGLLVIITLIVIRFRDPGPDLPNSLVLPNGTEALAFTQTGRWYAVVTEDDRILVFSRATGTLMREIQISRD